MQNRVRRERSVVVLGASLAGVRAAGAARRAGFAGRVTLVGDEPHFPPSNRPARVPSYRNQIVAEIEV